MKLICGNKNKHTYVRRKFWKHVEFNSFKLLRYKNLVNNFCSYGEMVIENIYVGKRLGVQGAKILEWFFSTLVLSQEILISLFEMNSGITDLAHNVVNSQIVSQQNEKSRRHHSL